MTSTVGEVIFWSAAVLCFVAQVAITRATLWPRSAEAPDDVNVPRPSRVRDAGWTLLPAVGLAFVLIFTWRAMHAPRVIDGSPSSVAATHHPGP